MSHLLQPRAVSLKAGMSASALTLVTLMFPTVVLGQGTAQARNAPAPAWSKGILPNSPESYYNAIECGKPSATTKSATWQVDTRRAGRVSGAARADIRKSCILERLLQPGDV